MERVLREKLAVLAEGQLVDVIEDEGMAEVIRRRTPVATDALAILNIGVAAAIRIAHIRQIRHQQASVPITRYRRDGSRESGHRASLIRQADSWLVCQIISTEVPQLISKTTPNRTASSGVVRRVYLSLCVTG
jgi:hypothetical protein